MQVLLLFLVSQVNLPTKYLTQHILDTFSKIKYRHLQKFILTDMCNHLQPILVNIVINILAVSIKTKWAGIATHYRLDGLLIEAQWRARFPHLFRVTLYNKYQSLSWRKSGWGMVLITHHLTPRLKKG